LVRGWPRTALGTGISMGAKQNDLGRDDY